MSIFSWIISVAFSRDRFRSALLAKRESPVTQSDYADRDEN
jgi:hypothetical protein